MPQICHFYPGITPRDFYALRLQDLNDLVEYMNDVQKQRQAAHRS